MAELRETHLRYLLAIQEAVEWMNNYPRKVLGWLTPAEAGRL